MREPWIECRGVLVEQHRRAVAYCVYPMPGDTPVAAGAATLPSNAIVVARSGRTDGMVRCTGPAFPLVAGPLRVAVRVPYLWPAASRY